MRNNCVSVSLARLQNSITVDELWKATYGQPLPDTPLNLEEIRELLRRTQWEYRWKTFVPSAREKQSAFQKLMKSFSPDYPTAFVLLYTRTAGSGHAINGIYDFAEWKLPVNWTFWDYQMTSEGEDRRSEVERATKIITLELELPTNSQTGDQLWKQLKEREGKLIAKKLYYPEFSL
ncbi:hypothetical protein FSARC_9500 [Fusarium sarcochroum]|uniref:Uncharacterized protein n=1 Tax=Fusarium sarcochroum TaxID=1208366 RepID=A0A8H4TQR7_9HYPO|nr:hypothetical protein FSARC_9500 [Fusarium sarcochroum]